MLTLRPRCGRSSHLMVPLYLGTASGWPPKTMTDSARSGPRPVPRARPPEFMVCPLMCQIRAFRYFWPISKP